MEIGFHQKDLHLGNSTKLENLSNVVLMRLKGEVHAD